MRPSLKSLLFYMIAGVILLNLYFLVQLYYQNQSSEENEQHHQRQSSEFFSEHRKRDRSIDKPPEKVYPLKNSNEFLVLDWTGHQHIFREQDPIKCKSQLVLDKQTNVRTKSSLLLVLEQRGSRSLIDHDLRA